MIKKLSITVPVFGLCLVAVWITISARKVPHAPPLVAPATSPYGRTIAATGVIEASDRNYNLAPPVPGQLTRIFVRENQVVRPGDKLYQIDASEQQSTVVAAEANVAKAEAGVTTAQSTILTQQANLGSARAAVDSAKASYDDAAQIADREDGLHKDGIVSEQAYLSALKTRDGALARWKQAQAQAEQAEAQLHNAQASLLEQRADLAVNRATSQQQRVVLARYTVRAPAEGRILQINNRVGEYLSSTPSTAPIIFGDTGSLLVRVDVDEINASHVQPGSRATATLKGDSSRRFPLEFVRIVPYMVPKQSLTGASSERVDVRVLQLEFRFPPPPFPVYVGQQVDVFIDSPEVATAAPPQP